ncbi:ABC transporter transmembrane domain-containing protein [uncultured Parolsenella sp.]|uniref:ABC transporter transmembrane domain-containing protein n=1 Tax=uncultured Parolsenella sp. TaxID=2083008 RepID=UPI0027D9A802|nr:ABC transporter transmembrane domain-containing protein [uncultured Parolsenella sp.]
MFDEATSNLDSESEEAIGAAIRGLAGAHTVIVVARRLAAVADADETLVMEGGRLVERGTHDALAAADGPYARMWHEQGELAAFASGAHAADASARPAATFAATATFAAATVVEQGDIGQNGAREAPKVSKYTEFGGGGRAVMARMMRLVRALAGWLVLAMFLGSVGMLAASFVAGFGAFGLMAAAGHPAGLVVVAACVLCVACGVARSPLHYGEQLCNHYTAFRLLAHVRNLVFGALRRLAPANLEGRGKGDLVSLVTSGIELLEVFYARTISPIAIAFVCVAAMEAFLASAAAELALVGLAAYALVGVALPLVGARLCGNAGRASRDGVGRMGPTCSTACAVVPRRSSMTARRHVSGDLTRSRTSSERSTRGSSVARPRPRRSPTCSCLQAAS